MKKYLITLLLLTWVIFQTQLFSYSGEIIWDTKCSEINESTRYSNLSPTIIEKIDLIWDRINEKYELKDNVYKEKVYNLFEKVLNEHLQKTTYSWVQKEVLLRIWDYFVCKKENLFQVEQEVINNFIYVNNIWVKVSEYQLENKPDNTLDNDLSTRWSADWVGQWIEYDLKIIKKIYWLEIATYVWDTRVFTFDVLTSLDWETYTKQLDKEETSWTTLNLEKHIFEIWVDARYIKILWYWNTQSNWNSITEVKFIETEEEAVIKTEEEIGVKVSEEESGIIWNENISTFVHPGIYHTAEELSSLRNRIGSEQYLRIKNSNLRYGTPNGTATFECGSYNSGDEAICNGWYKDWRSAEYWALRAYVEESITYASTAVLHIDRWASVFQDVSGSNAPLIAAWQLDKLGRAAEILLHNDYGFVYPAAEKGRMEAYADKLYTEARLANTQMGANWVAAELAARQGYWILKHGLAANTRDKDTAIAQFKYYTSFNNSIVESYIYLNSDGDKPFIFDSQGISKPYSDDQLYGAELWRLKNDATCFQTDGLIGEYWRDMWHSSMGFSFIGSLFEMSYIQGYKDFYEQHDIRLIAGLEIMYGTLLKKHLGVSGSYVQITCSNTATSLTEPKVHSASTRYESAHHATLYKRAKEKGWDIPLMEEYYANFIPADSYGPPSVYDYTFKGVD